MISSPSFHPTSTLKALNRPQLLSSPIYSPSFLSFRAFKSWKAGEKSCENIMALERTQPPSARFPSSIRAISRSATFTAIDSQLPSLRSRSLLSPPGRRENMSSLPQPAQISSSDSKGSFGPVFIVLGVIAVLAVIACVAGRLCARLMSEPKSGSRRRHHPRAVKDNDLEDGLQFDIPTLKPASKVANRDAQPADGGASKASVATKNAAGGVSKGATHPASSIQADKPSA